MEENGRSEFEVAGDDLAYVEKLVDDIVDSAVEDAELEGDPCHDLALATYLAGYLYGSNDAFRKILDSNPELAWDFAVNASASQSICNIPGASVISYMPQNAFYIGTFLKWIIKRLGKAAAKKALKKWLKKRLKKWIKAWAEKGWKGIWEKLKKKVPGWVLEMFALTIILELIESIFEEQGENLNDKQKKKLQWIKEQLEKGNITPEDAAGMIENLLK